MTELLAFVGVALLVIISPGQDTALTIRNTIAGGRSAGLRTATGVVCGQAVWALAASAGVAALFVASERAFLALRIVGAAYLVWLGLYTLLVALRPRDDTAPVAAAPARDGHELRQGLLSNLANPKMAILFSSLLPQFAESFFGLLALGLVVCALTLAWLSAYAAVIGRAGDLLRHSRARRAIAAVTGSVLVVFGLRLAAAGR